MTQYRNFWQGRLDSLCGLYCAVYVLEKCNASRKKSGIAQKSFFRLLESAENLNLLKAKNIAGSDDEAGFSAASIVRIFNKVDPEHRSRFRACEIVKKYPKFDGIVKELSDVFKAGGYVMIDVNAGRHWVLAKGLFDNGFVDCFDPAIDIGISSCRKAASGQGVIFAPDSSSI